MITTLLPFIQSLRRIARIAFGGDPTRLRLVNLDRSGNRGSPTA
jgi:hypothetical protein